MTTIELNAKIEELNSWKKLLEDAKREAEKLENEIKAEMENRNTEELVVGTHIVRWTTVLSNRFDTTKFKSMMPEVYKAYTKQSVSRRFTIS